MIAPLGHKGQALGALLMMSRSRRARRPDDRIGFARRSPSQISLALALARAFPAKDASERERTRATPAVLQYDPREHGRRRVVAAATARSALDNRAATRSCRRRWQHELSAASARDLADVARGALAASTVDQRGARSSRGLVTGWLSISARPLGDETRRRRGRACSATSPTSTRPRRAAWSPIAWPRSARSPPASRTRSTTRSRRCSATSRWRISDLASCRRERSVTSTRRARRGAPRRARGGRARARDRARPQAVLARRRGGPAARSTSSACSSRRCAWRGTRSATARARARLRAGAAASTRTSRGSGRCS